MIRPRIRFLLLFFSLWVCLPASAQEKFQPALAGPWHTLFAPKNSGDYINDHTLFQDPQGNWRLIGITSPGRSWTGLDERYFAHGISPSLDQEMTELDPLFKGTPDRRRKWAPHVIKDQDVYHLFAGPGSIRHFTSRNGLDWKYEGVAIAKPWWNFRDTMVLELAPGHWLMFATDQGDRVSVYESDDLFTWRRHGAAFRAVRPAPIWGWIPISATESPFVVKIGDYYYLSVCLTNYGRKTYTNTVIVRSKDPFDFGAYAAGGPGETAEYVTTLPAHCAEFIQDRQGNWYITSGGWKNYPTPAGVPPGTLAIAPIKWEAGP
jgi:hypothetical protein